MATAISVGQEGMTSGMQAYRAKGLAGSLGMPKSTVHKILCNMLHYYPYKITHVKKFLPDDLQVRHMFALEHLAFI